MIRQFALAASLAGLTAGPSLADETIYTIDSGHTHILFSVERFGYADTIGIFPDSSGEIVIDRDNPANSRVTASVHTPTVWTGLASRDEAVHSRFWLDTATHDSIRFTSTSVELVDEDSAHVTGDMTIWGNTQPVTFEVDLNRIGPDPSLEGREGIGFSMTASISRAAFGHEIAAGLIGDMVEIRIEVLAHAAE